MAIILISKPIIIISIAFKAKMISSYRLTIWMMRILKSLIWILSQI